MTADIVSLAIQYGRYLPDLNTNRPPDLPPEMSGLSVIEGGCDNMPPAEPAQPRRRSGGRDETQ